MTSLRLLIVVEVERPEQGTLPGTRLPALSQLDPLELAQAVTDERPLIAGTPPSHSGDRLLAYVVPRVLSASWEDTSVAVDGG